MKKLYTFIATLICLIFGSRSTAQVVAVDDAPISANIQTNYVIYNSDGSIFSVLQNDTNNGAPILPQSATVSVISGNNANISVNPTTGQVSVTTGLQSGTYTLTYQVCMNNGGACDTATVTITTCSIAAPTATLVAPTCETPPFAELGNLPSGNWTLLVDPYPFWTNDGNYTVTGNGNSHTLNLDPNVYQYRIRVLDATGCMSSYVEVSPPFNQLITSETQPTYFDANSDGIVNVGDTILCNITIQNLSECDLTNVMGEYNVIIFPAVNIPAGQSVTVTGIYQITAQDILNGTASDWEAVTGTSPLGNVYTKAFFTLLLPISSGFHFYAFADINGNGMHENDEPLVPYGTFVYEQNNASAVEVQSYTGEFNLFETNIANTYDVHFVPGATCANGFTSTFVYNDISINPGEITNHAFPLSPSDCADVGVFLYGNNAVPGFQSYSNIVVKNESLTEQTVTITYTADSLVTITDVNGGTSYTINGNTASITITIDPLETDYAYVYYTTPSIPLVALGDQLTFTAAITAIPNDAVAANNEAVCIKTIVGSFDPNSKSESHGDEILFSAFAQDETLNYTINFENSGTANAINVKLTDVLDAQLDETSVRLVGSTHAVQMSRMGNNLEFNFPNILLPPAEQGTMIGQGSVQFTVKMKPGFAVGDIVPNFASIIFDTNPAIVTNLVETEFVSQLGVSTFGSDVLRIYPNPASETMTVSGSTIDTVEIVDVTGKVVMRSSIGATEARIDVSGLANGVYLARIASADAIKTLRFIKQ